MGVAPSKCFVHYRMYLRNTKNKLWLQCKINNWKDHGCTTHRWILRERIFYVDISNNDINFLNIYTVMCSYRKISIPYLQGIDPSVNLCFILNFLVLQGLLLPPPGDFDLFCEKNSWLFSGTAQYCTHCQLIGNFNRTYSSMTQSLMFFSLLMWQQSIMHATFLFGCVVSMVTRCILVKSNLNWKSILRCLGSRSGVTWLWNTWGCCWDLFSF